MKKSNKHLYLIAAISFLVVSTASANEEERARELCKEAYSRASDQYKFMEQSECIIALSRPAEFWQCIIGRTDQGESFGFAHSNCQKVN